MENITKKLTDTIIHVAELHEQEDGSYALDKKPDMVCKATKLTTAGAVKFVEQNKPENVRYTVLGVEYDEHKYSISVENFVAHAERI